MEDMQELLVVNNLTYHYDNSPLLCELSFSVQPGENIAILGASGSGKSSLFKLISGLIPSPKNAISIQGISHPEAQSLVSYMMQEDLLLPWRTVLGNVLLPLELGHNAAPTSIQQEEALALLQKLGLFESRNKFPRELSGGMRQRAALARTLMQKRPLWLLDEPFNALDVSLREQLYDLLKNIQKEHQITLLMATHDFRDAVALADTIIYLGEGKIQRIWRLTDEQKKDPLALDALFNELRGAFAAQ